MKETQILYLAKIGDFLLRENKQAHNMDSII